MAVASRSTLSVRKPKAPLKAKAVNKLDPGFMPLSSKTGLHNGPRPGDKNVPILPSSQPAPMWLIRLCSLQRRSFIVTFLLIVGMLTVYGWTVYSQQKWNQAYRKLETLQRNERQLTTTNEVLKNKMALQAEQPATAMVPSQPTSAIFLPASQRPASANQPMIAATSPEFKTKLNPMPLGY